MSEVKRWAGLHRVLDDGLEIGTEAWTREVGPDQIRLTSVIDRTDEFEYEEEVEITLDPDWRPLQIMIDRESAEGERRYIGRRVGSAWISQVFRESGPMRTATLEFDTDTSIDYLSAHTSSLTVTRLGLAPEHGREVPVVSIDPETYIPSLVRHRYERLEDPESIEIEGFQATRVYLHQGVSGLEYTIWTTEDDIILRLEDQFEIVQLNTVIS